MSGPQPRGGGFAGSPTAPWQSPFSELPVVSVCFLLLFCATGASQRLCRVCFTFLLWLVSRPPSILTPLPGGEPLFQLVEGQASPLWAGFTVTSEWLFSGSLLNDSSFWRQPFEVLAILCTLHSVRAGPFGLCIKDGVSP